MTHLLKVVVLGPGATGGRFDRAKKVGAAETGGAFLFRVNDLVPPGLWIPDHVHHEAEEAWFVLEGTLTFRIDGDEVDAPKGSFVLVPRGTAHGFGNRGSTMAAFAQVFSPAETEGYFEEREQLRATTPPPPNADSFGLDPEVHEALRQKYHMQSLA